MTLKELFDITSADGGRWFYIYNKKEHFASQTYVKWECSNHTELLESCADRLNDTIEKIKVSLNDVRIYLK